MQCLQCGKGIPLFKRLGGSSEFCSDAHRREYQREFSQLALGRLMQTDLSESQAEPVQAPPLASAAAPAIDEKPAANVAPAAKPGPAPAWVELARPATTPSALAAKPNGIARSQPAPPIPAKKTASQTAASHPAAAKPAVIQKPAPAELQCALVVAPEFEHAFAALAPDRPRREPGMSAAELPHGPVMPWERRVEIVDSLARTKEHKLDMREVFRPVPTIALDLRIVPPESLETESRPLIIPVLPAAPDEASLWTGPYCEFPRELVSLSDFADDQFSKSGFEPPALAAGTSATAVREPLPTELQPAALESEPPAEATDASCADSQTGASAPTFRVRDPELDPLPVSSTGVAPGRAKPVPVFGPALVSTGTIQIPQPNGLPLRPVMVLATAAAPAEAKAPKSNVPSLRSALSIKPSLQQSSTLARLSSELNLGLPELRIEALAGPLASRMLKILAALTGAAVIGAGLFFSLGKQSDAGLKSRGPALAHGALGGQWIANFAPDARRERRVSLLRSSMNLQSYRLDFESSIRIKALGWVYRAQDSKNFYVSKIEFQKPGLNPVYALVHYAVINGVEQPRVETPLHVSVPMGGLYKIRFDAVGNRFTTWIQGQRIEQWTDARLSYGGAGLYGEGVEQSILHGEFAVTPLDK